MRLSGLVRLVRRICVLREQGDEAAAAALEDNEFSTAVRDFRLAEGPDALPEGELRTMFVNEERRVADAVVLAELLIPRLVGSIPAASAAGPRQSMNDSREEIVRHSRPAEPVSGSPAIPDLLDGMFAADDAARRQSANHRTNR